MGVVIRSLVAALPRVGLLLDYGLWAGRPPSPNERDTRASSQPKPGRMLNLEGTAQPGRPGIFGGANRQLARQPGRGARDPGRAAGAGSMRARTMGADQHCPGFGLTPRQQRGRRWAGQPMQLRRRDPERFPGRPPGRGLSYHRIRPRAYQRRRRGSSTPTRESRTSRATSKLSAWATFSKMSGLPGFPPSMTDNRELLRRERY